MFVKVCLRWTVFLHLDILMFWVLTVHLYFIDFSEVENRGWGKLELMGQINLGDQVSSSFLPLIKLSFGLKCYAINPPISLVLYLIPFCMEWNLVLIQNSIFFFYQHKSYFLSEKATLLTIVCGQLFPALLWSDNIL